MYILHTLSQCSCTGLISHELQIINYKIVLSFPFPAFFSQKENIITVLFFFLPLSLSPSLS